MNIQSALLDNVDINLLLPILCPLSIVTMEIKKKYIWLYKSDLFTHLICTIK